jgi:hypothetical protein
MVYKTKKVLILSIVVFVLLILFGVVILLISQKANILTLRPSSTTSISKEDLLTKYSFNTSTSTGVRKAINTDNKLDVWGLFEKADRDKLSISVGEDILTFALTPEIRVLQPSSDPKNYKYLGFKDLVVGTRLVVTVLEKNDNSGKYIVDFVQIPTMP